MGQLLRFWKQEKPDVMGRGMRTRAPEVAYTDNEELEGEV